MEFALHINHPAEATTWLDGNWVSSFKGEARLEAVVKSALALAEEYFGPMRVTRWVYGNEFCEHLIPRLEQLAEVVTTAEANGIELTFLTPYVSDNGIESLKPLLEFLDDAGLPAEVVFNDWGVLNLLRLQFTRVTPVQGRLLNKSLRDPRITGVYAASQAPAPALISLRRSNLDCNSYSTFLSSLGVSVAEFDNLPQGVDLDLDGRMRAAVYFPFGFISTSRICMAAGLHYLKRDKFQPGAPCRHECQTHLVEYTYSNSPFGNRDQKFYLKGNTYFYHHTEPMLRTLFEQARAGSVERLIFQPRLPMMSESD